METTEWAPETPGVSLVLNYPDHCIQWRIFSRVRFIDSGGMEYRVKRSPSSGGRTHFSTWGTLPFQAALKPDGAIGPHGKEIATERIQGAMSVPELIEVCRSPWERR